MKRSRHKPTVLEEAAKRRRRWFRVAAAGLLPLLALAVLELGLRLGGYGYSTTFFVHHPAAGPETLVENQRFPWRFFPRTLARHPNPVRISPTKPPGVCRLFVLGESAAEGDPAPAFGFSRILQVLLQDRYPAVRFEVVNVAFTAINSHVILPIARDCQRLQGDFWLVYMGNNEVIGPFGTGTVFGQPSPPLPVIRAALALKTTRTGQGLDALMQRLWPTRDAARGWGGMTMFMGQQVRRGDPRLPVLRRNFQRNLSDILDLGTKGGARVLVSTVVSRLRDWPPFGSLHRADLDEARRLEWEKLYQAGVAAEQAGDVQGAIRWYEQAAQIDDEFAELHFRWGRCSLALGKASEAQTHFILARDYDTLRFRADSALNDAIRQTVAAHSGERVRLLDADQAFARQSTNGIPGEEWFHEHVHFTFAGNYLLARLFAGEVAGLLPPSLAAQTTPTRDWLPVETCAARLGFSDSERHEVLRLIRGRFEEPIYRQQLGYAERSSRLEAQLADLRGAAKPAARQRAVGICRQALALAADDWVLHDLTASLLGNLDDYGAAEAEWREVTRLLPHAARPYTEIGKLMQQQGKVSEATMAFTRAIELNPDSVDAHIGLGTLSAQQGRRAEAIRHFSQAFQLDPARSEAVEGLAKLGAGPTRRPR